MEMSLLVKDPVVKREGPVTLHSTRNPTPVKTICLSNLDQTVAFPVETIFFYGAPPVDNTFDIVEMVRRSVSEVLLIPYYFLAGRLNFDMKNERLELVCNNAGVLFSAATSSLRLDELGDLSLPNTSFRNLIIQMEGFASLADTPVFTIQVTRFKCGGYSLGFVMNHSTMDGRSAAEMFNNLGAICRGKGLEHHVLDMDRSCIKARYPPQIKFEHPEYTKPAETTILASSFTSPAQDSPTPCLSKPPRSQEFKMVSFSSGMIKSLKEKAMIKCSSFEAVVAHIWRSRTKAVFEDPDTVSAVLFAVDVRNKMSPPLPHGFVGNAVAAASVRATVKDIGDKPFSFCVNLVREAIERITDEYVRSAVDWLEVYKGVPSVQNGNFFLSAWWKLPFHEVDIGWGKPIYSGPVVGGMHEFVLLLPGEENGVNVWIALEQEKMDKFLAVYYQV